MRLSDADRELLFGRLSVHAAQGRLGLDELERRVAAVSAAQTAEQAAEILADLPALAGDPPPGRAGWGRGHGDADQVTAGWRPTNERFRDPRTRRVMRVWEDAGGARHYVADDEA